MRHLFVAATLAAALPFADLPSQFEKIAPAAKGRVGVAAQLLESGETASLHGDEHFPMHSVYKLPISMAVLQRFDRGELKLDQLVRVEPGDFVRKGMYSPVRDKYPDGTELSIAELLRYTICESDGSTSDVLMKLIGGPGKVMLFLEGIHVPDIEVVNYEKEIGRDWETQYRNWATPKAALALLAALQSKRGLSAESQALLLKLMTESIPGAKRLKGELPALKTASPPRLTTSALSPFPMVDTLRWPHSSPIPPPMMTRGMRSSPAWPKPPGIAP